MVISILGCGWYGKALAIELIENGYKVKGSTTASEKLRELTDLGIESFIVNADNGYSLNHSAFFKCDLLVICIPPKRKTGESREYIKKLNLIIEAAKANNISRTIYISSTGVYGNNKAEVDESNDPNPDSESGKILLEAEELFKNTKFLSTSIIRFGGLIGPGRHPARFFAGKTLIPNGLAPVNLIHLSDCIAITEAIIANSILGYTFNACHPSHPQKAVFYTKMVEKAGLARPEFIDELQEWKKVKSLNLPILLKYQFFNASLFDYPYDSIATNQQNRT